MLHPERDITLIAVATAAACALPGVFLVLKRQALLSDAIGHSILLGIVTTYLIVGDLDSPWFLAGAGLTGVATAFLVGIVNRSGLVREDTAIGLVFPILF